jgi:hypothetical protein
MGSCKLVDLDVRLRRTINWHLQVISMGVTGLMTRRELMKVLGAGAVSPVLFGASKSFGSPTKNEWVKYKGNPVLGGQYGTCFDICVLRESGIYRMWVSWRPKQSVAITQSKDGIVWSAPEVVLPPDPSTGWEDDINRPIVVRREDGYHMWYTGQAKEMGAADKAANLAG